MILKNMRWGYDCGGVGCGPVDGNYFVEAMVTDETTKFNYFVLCSHFAEAYKIEVSEMPIFDIMIHAFDYDVDFEHEFGKLKNVVIEEYDFERLDHRFCYEDDDDSKEDPKGFAVYDCAEMFESRFSNTIKLSLKAMEILCDMEDPDKADVMDIAGDYLETNIDKQDIDI